MSAEARIITHLLIVVLTPIFIAALIYFLGSFTAANLNPFEWTQGSRGFAVVIWFFLTVVATIGCVAFAEIQIESYEKLLRDERK